jgi:hypothetical protein
MIAEFRQFQVKGNATIGCDLPVLIGRLPVAGHAAPSGRFYLRRFRLLGAVLARALSLIF